METTKFEIIMAIIIGLVAGVLITFGVTGKYKDFKFSSPFKKPQQSAITSPAANAPSVSAKKTEENFITIEPAGEDYVSTSSAIIKGSTNRKNRLIVSTEKQDFIFTPENNGNFQIPVALYPGVNEIDIISFNDSSEISKSINLYYIP